MKSKLILLLATATFCTTTAFAARVDMNDPRRALATDDDLRIDAQLGDDTIGSGSSVSVTFQIQNNTRQPIAIASKVVDTSYDAESQTVTVSIGAEIPNGTTMPQLTVVKSGEKKTFTAGSTIHLMLPSVRSPFIAYPRYVQVKVNVLRDIAPFSDLIAQQRETAQSPLPDTLFETWVQNNDAIFLNTIPVHWKNGRSEGDQNGADLSAPITHTAMGGTF